MNRSCTKPIQSVLVGDPDFHMISLQFLVAAMAEPSESAVSGDGEGRTGTKQDQKVTKSGPKADRAQGLR